MALLRYCSLLALAAILLMGIPSSLAGGATPSQIGGPKCTVTLPPQDKIQDIIDKIELDEGSDTVICLEEGMYQENLKITKSLTLRGQGARGKPTAIIGDDASAPVILIKSESSKIQVRLEGFIVARSESSDASTESDGIDIQGDVIVTIIGLEITGNGRNGLVIGGVAEAKVESSAIEANGRNGLVIGGVAEAKVESSTIKANGTYERCQNPDFICNGIEVWGKSKTTINQSKVRFNADWGIAAVLKKCGYDEDQFTGRVIIRGTSIENNNQSGNHHDDGQECLP